MLRLFALWLACGSALLLAGRIQAADQSPAQPAQATEQHPAPVTEPQATRPVRRAAQGPPQPIPFSHRIHAGVNQIGCLLCHTYAEHSPVAGIPSLARCVGCHKFIDKDKPDVKAVTQAFQKGRVPAWSRVYRVPDMVFFTHERHVAAGIRCQQCHGEVEKMDVMKKVSPLTMGWCLDCHHQRQAPADCLTCHK